jgi:hypothetical protein
MKVQILDRIADHRRSYEAGEVCDLSEDQATNWIARGLAVAVTSTEAPVVVAPEAAALKAPEETATLPKAAKR